MLYTKSQMKLSFISVTDAGRFDAMASLHLEVCSNRWVVKPGAQAESGASRLIKAGESYILQPLLCQQAQPWQHSVLS